jgi:hypothetical protein
MAETIRRFSSMAPAERGQMSANGLRAAGEQFGRERLVAKVADMLKSVVAEHRP